MCHNASLAIWLAIFSASALAQQPAPLHGKWLGVIKGQGGGELSVELVLAETGSTWRFLPRGNQGHRNPCVGREFPVVLKSQTATELSFEIRGAQILQGCINQTATLTSTDGKTLEGSLADGRAVSLSRE